MLKKIYQLLFKYRLKNSIAGRIIPIVKTTKYMSGLSEQHIKSNLIRAIEPELMQYITFDVKESSEGVMLMTARLDVLKREEIVTDGEQR